jgi:hypothetical protein
LQLPLSQLELFIVPKPEPEQPRKTHGPAPRHQPRGVVYDLEKYFNVINKVVFRDELEFPVLRWSRYRWHTVLGLYDIKRNVITINRALDDARIPDLVLADVLHHEMLHEFFGVTEDKDGRRKIHPPSFRLSEKQFPAHTPAEKWLNENWPLRGRPAKRIKETEGSFLNFLAMIVP